MTEKNAKEAIRAKSTRRLILALAIGLCVLNIGLMVFVLMAR